MTNEQIIEMAKQAGDDWDHTLQSDKEFLQRFAELVRNAALEEAANVCDGWLHADGDTCAEAIRSMKK